MLHNGTHGQVGRYRFVRRIGNDKPCVYKTDQLSDGKLGSSPETGFAEVSCDVTRSGLLARIASALTKLRKMLAVRRLIFHGRIVRIAIQPALSGLGRSNHGMTAGPGVLGGMPVG